MSVRLNTTVSEELLEKIDRKSREYGISRSATMSVIMAEYFKNDDALNAMSRMMQMVEEGKKVECDQTGIDAN